MNGQPAALAYMPGPDGRYEPVCLTVMTLDAQRRISVVTVFALPELFAAWGFPSTLACSTTASAASAGAQGAPGTV